MKFNEETPSVNVKRKNISAIMEYCVENKIEFSVKPLISRSEEYEMDFEVSNTRVAVALGMYLKELRLELNGAQAVIPSVVASSAPAKASKKSAVKESTNGHSKEEPVAISFDNAEKLEFNVETTNN